MGFFCPIWSVLNSSLSSIPLVFLFLFSHIIPALPFEVSAAFPPKTYVPPPSVWSREMTH